MFDWPNVTASGRQEPGLKPEELQKSKCVLGFIPVVYYSILLCIGVPGTVNASAAHRLPGHMQVEPSGSAPPDVRTREVKTRGEQLR